MNKSAGIQLHLPEAKLVYHHLLVEQRAQLHVDHQCLDIRHGVFHLGQGVVSLDDLYAFHT